MNKNRIAFGILFSIVVTMSLSVLSASPSFAQVSNPSMDYHGPPVDWKGHVPIHLKKDSTTTTPGGYTPQQITHAYGLDQLSCNTSQSCGSGQVIAIVDAYDNPNVESDLSTFSTQFGLPDCTSANGCFTKVTVGSPTFDQGWALEEALDVQWAHAIAPGAKIVLVEAASSSFSDLLNAINYASTQTGANQVSMSWGGNEFHGEPSYDKYFQVPGVSFTASSGDSGSGVIWPSVSPYVLGVGGTTLNLDSAGNVQSETAWSGSGGGTSKYESEPTYQSNYGVSSNKRAVPDVSYNADPNTGFPVYETFGYSGQTGWFVVGGTSAGAPQWAAALAIANSGLATPLSSVNFGTETTLYQAATGSAYSQDYRDITSGSNGGCPTCQAGTGYDDVTGVGSPLANNLVPFITGGTPPPPPTPSLSATANPTTIDTTQSSTITISTSDSASGVVVTLSPSSGSLSASSCTTGGTGSCFVTFSSSSATTAKITASASGYTGTSVPVTVTSSTSGGSLGVSVSTDSNSYTAKSWAIITVHVSSGGTAVSGASVNVTVTDASGGQSTGSGTTNSNGDASFKYRISPHPALGTYTVDALASAAGYPDGSGSTQFSVN